jgi:hypothetical protein
MTEVYCHRDMNFGLFGRYLAGFLSEKLQFGQK